MQDKSKSPLEEAKIFQLIVFNLGDEEYAADISQVREIIRIGDITSMPDSPEFIKGVTNVRGEITVVIDLKARFFLPINNEVESKHIVITEQEKNLYGLMVDEVTEVLRIPEKEIKPPPELVTRADRIYISGVLTLENRLMMLLDLTKVLSEEELARLSEIRLKHRAPSEQRVKAEDQKHKAEETKKEADAEAQKKADSLEEASVASAAGKKRGRK